MAAIRSWRQWRPLARLAGDRSGVSAVEFALILPILLALYLGGNELGHALTIDRKVTHVTSAVADLVTQAKTISNSEMTNILDAAESIMTPYLTTDLKIKVSFVTIDADSVATVVWSDARNDTAFAPGTEIQLPAGIKQPDTYLIVSEVHYNYVPIIGYVMTGNFDLSDTFYLRPRLSETIARTAT